MLDSLENILLKQPVQEGSCILTDKVHFFCGLSLPLVGSQHLQGTTILSFRAWERDARPPKLLQNIQIQARRGNRLITFPLFFVSLIFPQPSVSPLTFAQICPSCSYGVLEIQRRPHLRLPNQADLFPDIKVLPLKGEDIG